LSYSRTDSAIVRRLCDAFAAEGRGIWVDWEDIPPSAEWWKEIEAGIKASDAFVCMLSHRYLQSATCVREAGYARQLGKKIIPVVCETLAASDVPPNLAALNWIFLRAEDNFDRGISQLCRAIDTDLDWVRAHTLWLGRSLEWEAGGSDDGALLRGKVLEKAEAWLRSAGADREPAPTALQTKYILLSRQKAVRSQRRSFIAVFAAAAVLLVAASVAWIQRSEKERQRLLAVSRELSAYSTLELNRNRTQALLLARRALDVADTHQAQDALAAAVLAYPPRVPLGGPPTGELVSSVFSPDGTWLAAVAKDGAGRVWVSETGALLGELTGARGGLRHVSVSPNGLLILGTGEAARLWDARTLQPIGEEIEGTGGIKAATFGKIGKLILTRNGDGTAATFEAATRRKLAQFRVSEGRMTYAALSPDEALVLTAHEDGIARLWNALTGEMIKEFKGHTHTLSMAEFCPDGRCILTLASGFPVNEAIAKEESRGVITSGPLIGGRIMGMPEPDNTGRFWDLTSGRETKRFRLWDTFPSAVFAPGGWKLAVTSFGNTDFLDIAGDAVTGKGFNGRLAGFDADGSVFATLEHDLTVRVRRMRDFETVGFFPAKLAQLAPNGSRLLTANPDGTAFIWDVQEGASTLRQSAKDYQSVSFSADGAMAATIDTNGMARLWDGKSGADLTAEKAPELSSHPVRTAVFGKDSSFLFILDAAGRIFARNLASARAEPLDIPARAESISLNSEGTRLLIRFTTPSGKDECKILLWNVETGGKAGEICVPDETLPYARFSPDGAWIFTTRKYGPSIWDGHDGSPIADLAAPNAYISDGNRQWVTTAQSGRSVQLWAPATGARGLELPAFARRDMSSSRVESVFSKDGTLLMTFGEPIRIWAAGTGEKKAEFEASGAVISPDGRLAISVRVTSNDTGARIWDISSRKAVAELSHSGVVQSAGFTPDGDWVITTSGGTIGLWDAHSGNKLRELFTPNPETVSARLAPGGRWLEVWFRAEGGQRVRIYPWERFAPMNKLLSLVRVLAPEAEIRDTSKGEWR
jgi:WD40 repeat protein